MLTAELQGIKDVAGDGMIYLASPYSHDDEAVRLERFRQSVRAAGKLMNLGCKVYSAIGHSHPIAVECNLPLGWDYWEAFDRWYIERCSCVVVLILKGWDESSGVKAEMKIASELGKPIRWMSQVE